MTYGLRLRDNNNQISLSTEFGGFPYAGYIDIYTSAQSGYMDFPQYQGLKMIVYCSNWYEDGGYVVVTYNNGVPRITWTNMRWSYIYYFLVEQ